uniref:Chassatide C4 n=1 Tax=Chassalia chartacea TaxID=510798 RepID=CYC4_CHACT|nr:RecName: Full=Chassatide C4; AltName: Full=Cyclotide chaC4; Flags: Precursor [Chassalia chartacea]AFH57353.1 cyclotide precursor chassatide C4 [Chassalia chartacea]
MAKFATQLFLLTASVVMLEVQSSIVIMQDPDLGRKLIMNPANGASCGETCFTGICFTAGCSCNPWPTCTRNGLNPESI